MDIASLPGADSPTGGKTAGGTHGDQLPPVRAPSNPVSRLGERIFRVHERGSTWLCEFRCGKIAGGWRPRLMCTCKCITANNACLAGNGMLLGLQRLANAPACRQLEPPPPLSPHARAICRAGCVLFMTSVSGRHMGGLRVPEPL